MSTNVTSVEPDRRINPDLIGSPYGNNGSSAAQRHLPARRLTRLDADYYAAHEQAPTPRATAAPASRSAAPRDRVLLRWLERVVGGWAPTLRASLLLVTLFVVAGVVVICTLGFDGLLLVSALAIVLTRLDAAGR
jgi:hypothetical protein